MKHAFILLSFLSCALLMQAQTNLQFLSGTTGAGCQSIKYYNDYVFTGTGSTLRSYHVGGGATVPYSYGFEYRYQSEIIRMKVKDHYLFVCANYDGLTKWDISNPAAPVKVYDILPDSTGMSTQGVAFKGDTLYVAQYSKMCAYKDNGSSCTKISNFAYPQFGSYITGVDVNYNVVAVNTQHLGSENGVHFYDATDFSFLSFFQQGTFLSENVIWGKNNHLLHVMSGTSINVFAPNGLFYSLDMSNPLTPVKVYSDTVPGIYLAAIALPFNAENINDTIYMSCWGGMKPSGPLDTLFVRAYDATNPSNIHIINYLPAGLWNFDMTVHYPKMHVASEWYGIQTVDITDIAHPVVLGKTLTGGWNNDAGVWGNYMVVANEGFGFKLFDISNPLNPVLVNENHDPGFCKRVEFSDDGNYIYGAYDTYHLFRVYDRSTLTEQGFIQQQLCDGRFLVYQQRMFTAVNNNLKIIDVSLPSAPVVDSSITININDMALDASGKLYLSNNDSVFVFDVSGNGFHLIATKAMSAGQDAKMMAVFGDMAYIFVTNKGLVKYQLVFNNPTFSLYEINTYTLPNGSPTFMAADTFGLYCAYRLYGLYAYDRQTLVQTSYFRGGLDYHHFADQYGVQNLFCKNNFIYLVEYFCQTSILTNDNNFNGIAENISTNSFITIYPNPGEGKFTVESLKYKVERIEVYNVLGEKVYSSAVSSHTSTGLSMTVDLSGQPAGVYFVKTKTEQGIYVSKLIKQ